MDESKNKVTDGRVVTFTPSARTRREKFATAREDKKTFPAIVKDVNEDSVDLTVFGPETVHVSRVKHVSDAEEGKSSWEWPAKSN